MRQKPLQIRLKVQAIALVLKEDQVCAERRQVGAEVAVQRLDLGARVAGPQALGFRPQRHRRVDGRPLAFQRLDALPDAAPLPLGLRDRGRRLGRLVVGIHDGLRRLGGGRPRVAREVELALGRVERESVVAAAVETHRHVLRERGRLRVLQVLQPRQGLEVRPIIPGVGRRVEPEVGQIGHGIGLREALDAALEHDGRLVVRAPRRKLGHEPAPRLVGRLDDARHIRAADVLVLLLSDAIQGLGALPLAPIVEPGHELPDDPEGLRALVQVVLRVDLGDGLERVLEDVPRVAHRFEAVAQLFALVPLVFRVDDDVRRLDDEPLDLGLGRRVVALRRARLEDGALREGELVREALRQGHGVALQGTRVAPQPAFRGRARRVPLLPVPRVLDGLQRLVQVPPFEFARRRRRPPAAALGLVEVLLVGAQALLREALAPPQRRVVDPLREVLEALGQESPHGPANVVDAGGVVLPFRAAGVELVVQLHRNRFTERRHGGLARRGARGRRGGGRGQRGLVHFSDRAEAPLRPVPHEHATVLFHGSPARVVVGPEVGLPAFTRRRVVEVELADLVQDVLGRDRVPPQREPELEDRVALAPQPRREVRVDVRGVRVVVVVEEVLDQGVVDDGQVEVAQRPPVVQRRRRALVLHGPEARLAPERAAAADLVDELGREDVQRGEARVPAAVRAQPEEDHLRVRQPELVAEVRHDLLRRARARLAPAEHVPRPEPRLLEVQGAVGVAPPPLAGREARLAVVLAVRSVRRPQRSLLRLVQRQRALVRRLQFKKSRCRKLVYYNSGFLLIALTVERLLRGRARAVDGVGGDLRPHVVGDLRDGAPARARSEAAQNCGVCLERARGVVFKPCFHVVSCWNCGLRVSECPFAALAALAAAASSQSRRGRGPPSRAADAAAHPPGLRSGRGVWCCCRGPATSRCPSARTTSTRAQYVRLAERSRVVL